MSPRPRPRCLHCGKPIPKVTRIVYAPHVGAHSVVPVAGWDYHGDSPVVARRYAMVDPVEGNFVTNYDDPERTARAERRLYSVTVWDGEAYLPRFDYFDTMRCAAEYGRAAAGARFRRHG